MTERELMDEVYKSGEEYQLAYSVVRQTMTLFPEPDLQSLRTVLYFAHCFVSEELDQMPDKAQELGLDVWMAKQADDEALEEQERLEREECEREEQEELNRLDALWSQYDSDEA